MWSSSRGSSNASSAGWSALPSPSSNANRLRSSSDMVAYLRPRFLAMTLTPVGCLEQGFHPSQVFVEFGARIRAQQLHHRLAGTADGWMVAEAQVHPGSGSHPGETNDPGVFQHRAGLAAPGDDLVGRLFRQHGAPFDRHST